LGIPHGNPTYRIPEVMVKQNIDDAKAYRDPVFDVEHCEPRVDVGYDYTQLTLE